jgi:hypothetical protein
VGEHQKPSDFRDFAGESAEKSKRLCVYLHGKVMIAHAIDGLWVLSVRRADVWGRRAMFIRKPGMGPCTGCAWTPA